MQNFRGYHGKDYKCLAVQSTPACQHNRCAVLCCHAELARMVVDSFNRTQSYCSDASHYWHKSCYLYINKQKNALQRSKSCFERPAPRYEHIFCHVLCSRKAFFTILVGLNRTKIIPPSRSYNNYSVNLTYKSQFGCRGCSSGRFWPHDLSCLFLMDARHLNDHLPVNQ